MSEATVGWELVRIDLDRGASEAQKQRARELFRVEHLGVRGRYGLEVDTIIEVLGVVVAGSMGSALWDLLKWTVPRVRDYLTSGAVSDGGVATTFIRLEATGLTWEIRYRSDQDMSKYRAGVLIEYVDTASLPDDTSRISINLCEGKIAAFDQTGLRVAELPWPVGLVGTGSTD